MILTKHKTVFFAVKAMKFFLHYIARRTNLTPWCIRTRSGLPGSRGRSKW